MPKKRSGIIIALEGPDWSGKTYTAHTLKDLINKQQEGLAQVFKFPNIDSPDIMFSDIIKKQLHNPTMDTDDIQRLMILNIVDQMVKKVKPFVENGGIAILDRYFLSTIVYDRISSTGNDSHLIADIATILSILKNKSIKTENDSAICTFNLKEFSEFIFSEKSMIDLYPDLIFCMTKPFSIIQQMMNKSKSNEEKTDVNDKNSSIVEKNISNYYSLIFSITHKNSLYFRNTYITFECPNFRDISVYDTREYNVDDTNHIIHSICNAQLSEVIEESIDYINQSMNLSLKKE